MSINKVLNRPIFRQQALKKGHLKPIKANEGIMVGPPTQNITGQIQRNYPLTNIPQPKTPGLIKRTLRGAFSLPFFLGFDATKSALDKSDTGNNLSETQKNIGATAGGGLSALAASKVAPAAMTMGFLPSLLVGGSIYGLANRVQAGIDLRKKINAMDEKEREAHKRRSMAFGTEGYLDDEAFKEQFGLYKEPEKAKTNEQVLSEVQESKKIRPKNPRGIRKKTVEKEKDQKDLLTQNDNETKIGNETVVDTNKVAQNSDVSSIKSIAPNPPDMGAGGAELSEMDQGNIKTNQGTVTTNETDQKVATTDSGQSGAGTGQGKVAAGDGTPVTDDVIARAREIRNELAEGRSSQAGLVFLANLASGLLSGTTSKAGVGGALEVFGKALGPAVNNYATIKLKENELENELMGDALELASDEMQARNDLLEAQASGGELEFNKFGIIQFTDVNGRLRNATGGLLKNGTYVIAAPGQLDANGRQLYLPMSTGSFNRFLDSDYAVKEQGQTLKSLSGKYKAFNLGRNTIKILEDALASGKTLGGPKGRLSLFTTRLSSVAEDFGVPGFNSEEDGQAYINQLKEGFKNELMQDGMSSQEAQKFLDKNFGDSNSIYDKTYNLLKSQFKDETDAANLERLAINETVLTYALANALKDKDRLTQKDIQMAKDLVNVFPLLRGQKQVIRSLEAVNETILADIQRAENDYQFAFGGDSHTIDQYRQRYGLSIDQGPQFEIENPFKDQSTQELLEQF